MEVLVLNREPVESSNLNSVGYEPDTKTLEIEFHDGGIYQYFDVPEHIHADLMSASSHGKYFHANIRKNFRYEKI